MIFQKKKLLVANLELQKRELNQGSEGNLSFRTDKGFYITPSAKDPRKTLYSDLVFVSLDGKFSHELSPSSEWRMHMKIYNNFSNINYIIHSHSIFASIISCFRIKIPFFHYMVAEFGGNDIKCARYATFGTNQLAENIVTVLKNRNGCLISNHGQITVGVSLENTLHLAFALEKLAKQYYFCKLAGGIKLINKNQMNEAIKLFDSYKSRH